MRIFDCKGKCPNISDPNDVRKEHFQATSTGVSESNQPYHARLGGMSCWSTYGNNQWISVSLPGVETIVGIATQGGQYGDCFVNKYKIKYREINTTASSVWYKEKNAEKVSPFFFN